MSALTSVHAAAVSAVRAAGSARGARPTPAGADAHRLAQLLLASAAQDAEAFEEFYRSTNAILFGILSTRLRSRPAVESTLVETYVQIWRRAGEFACGNDGSAWQWTLLVLYETAAGLPPRSGRRTDRRP